MNWHFPGRNAANDNQEVVVAENGCSAPTTPYKVATERVVYVASLQYYNEGGIAPSTKILVTDKDKEKLLPLIGKTVRVMTVFEIVAELDVDEPLPQGKEAAEPDKGDISPEGGPLVE